MEIKIQEPWWSAWQKFGWAKGVWGIGLAVKDIEKAITLGEPLVLSIHGHRERYKISPVTAKHYAEKNRTEYTAKFGTKLYVVPQTELLKVR